MTCHVAGRSQAGRSGLSPASDTLVSGATADTQVTRDICKGVVKVASPLVVCKCICTRLDGHDGARSERGMPGLVSQLSAPLSYFFPSSSKPVLCPSKCLLLICSLISPLRVCAKPLLGSVTPRGFNIPPHFAGVKLRLEAGVVGSHTIARG